MSRFRELLNDVLPQGSGGSRREGVPAQPPEHEPADNAWLRQALSGDVGELGAAFAHAVQEQHQGPAARIIVLAAGRQRKEIVVAVGIGDGAQRTRKLGVSGDSIKYLH